MAMAMAMETEPESEPKIDLDLEAAAQQQVMETEPLRLEAAAQQQVMATEPLRRVAAAAQQQVTETVTETETETETEPLRLLQRLSQRFPQSLRNSGHLSHQSQDSMQCTRSGRFLVPFQLGWWSTGTYYPLTTNQSRTRIGRCCVCTIAPSLCGCLPVRQVHRAAQCVCMAC